MPKLISWAWAARAVSAAVPNAAMATALALGEYLAGAVVGLMLSGGNALEAVAAGRARRELRTLVERAPRIAHRHEGDRLVEVSVEELVPGDELVVRLVVTSDRDYEFLELSDHRPSLTEPVDVLSGWRYGDGTAWYVAIRDASTQMFFERLPRGTHVFEYALRAAHRGTASSGFATIQSRYAPEFSARSASVNLEVK